MLYKISLDDNSFIIANDEYMLTLFRHGKKKKISVKDYLITNKYWKYHLIDYINNTKVKRYFIIEPITTSSYSIGSRIKLAKDIKVNDIVLGADGKPRRVKELHTGEDDMFEINIEGTKYVVNGGHILELVNKTTGEHLEMPVNVFIHMNDDFKSYYVMEKVIKEEKENG